MKKLFGLVFVLIPVAAYADLIGGTIGSLSGGGGSVTSVSGTNGASSTGGATPVISVSSVSLSSQVIGNLPVGNLNSGTNATSSTFWRGDGTWVSSSSFGGGSGSGATINNGSPYNVPYYSVASSNTLSASTIFSLNPSSVAVTGSGGLSVTYGVTAGSAVVNNLTSLPVQADGSHNLIGSLISLSSGVTGTVASGNFPALTGDVTTPGASLATTAAAQQANITTFTSSITVTNASGLSVKYGISAGSITLNGNGAGQLQYKEDADSTTFTPAASKDNAWASISSHTFVFNPNNTSTYTIVGSSTVPVNGHAAQWSSQFGLIDAGAPANQTITLSGDSTGSGTSAITVTAAAQQNNITTFGSSITVNGSGGLKVLYGTSGSTATLINSGTANTLLIATNTTTLINQVAVSSTIAAKNTDYIMMISSAIVGGGGIFGVENGGGIVSSGTLPTIGACGTTPAMKANSTNVVGSVVWASTTSSCAFTFANAGYGTAPFCTANLTGGSTNFAGPFGVTATSATFNFSGNGVAASTLTYTCIGGSGG